MNKVTFIKMVDIITNVIAGVLVVLEPVRWFLASAPDTFNVWTFILCLCGAIVAYFEGKSAKKAISNS